MAKVKEEEKEAQKEERNVEEEKKKLLGEPLEASQFFSGIY